MKRLWIVIERQTPNYPVICVDENGAPEIFENHNKACEYAKDCQDGLVVALF